MTEPGPWDADASRWQEIVNELPIPSMSAQVVAPALVPVTVRIVWSVDGEERIATYALGWSGRSALVRIEDQRRQTIGVWLDAGDVERREDAG